MTLALTDLCNLSDFVCVCSLCAQAAAEAAIADEMARQQQEALWRMKEEAEEALRAVAGKRWVHANQYTLYTT